MTRWIGIIAAILLGLLLITGGYVAYAVNRTASAGPITRTAEPKVVWGEQPVVVSVIIDTATLPTCPTANTGADIVLLVDRSDSMEGQPFTDALAAVQIFLDSVDFANNKVAVLFFNNTVQGQSLTVNRTLFENTLSGQTTEGGTAMDVALNAAATEFASTAHRPDANKIVVLVTDGAANDPISTDAAANGLKAQGVRLVTVALGNDFLAHQYLSTVASSSSDAYVSPTSADLALIYRSIAEGINTTIATNVQMNERINTEAFELLPNSALPPGLMSGDSVTWAVPALSQSGGIYRYRVLPQQLGLLTINQTGGQASLEDCQGNLPSYTLPTGPDVFVAPGWLLPLLILFPLLLLAFGLWWWWRNRPTPVRPTPTPLIEPVAPEPVDETPAWLKALTVSKIVPGSASSRQNSNLQPTVLIGLGPAGREVLTQIAQNLRTRFGGEIPDSVRLLQVDVFAGKGEKPPLAIGLDDHHRVLLEPNLQEVEENLRNNPKEWAHWHWYEEAQRERGKGRMAFFYDVKDGEQRSNLWRALNRTFNALSKPKVRLIGTTFDDIGSSMLVDVAYLCQVVTKQQASDIELWLAAPLGQPWSERLDNPRQKVGDAEQRARTLATLREIERFQRNKATAYLYANERTPQEELRQSRRPGVIESLFLFEPQQNISRPERDVFAVMTESLLALLHVNANQAMMQQLQTNRITAGQLRNDEGMGMTYAVGAYSVRVPTQILSPLLGWRFVHDMLFEPRRGLYPLETLNANGTYTRLTDEEIAKLLDYNASKERASKFANTIGRTGGPGYESPTFRVQLRQQVDWALNGESDSLLGHTDGLRQARLWLTGLRNKLINSGGRNSTEPVNALIKEIEAWETWFVETIHPIVTQAIGQHRDELRHLKEETARDWMIKDDLELPYYAPIVPLVTQETAIRSEDNLVQAGKRFGWEIRSKQEGKGYILRLLIPNPDYIFDSGVKQYDIFAFDRTTDPMRSVAALYAIATRYTRLSQDGQALMQHAISNDKDTWETGAKLRITYNQAETSRLMRQSGQSTIVVGPLGPQLNTLVAKIRENGAGTWAVIATDDNSAVTLLRVTDAVPLATTALYNEERWRDALPMTQHYVWPAEQTAATHEKNAKLSTHFTSWLAVDEEVVHLFARSYLYDLLTRDDENRWEIPGVGAIPGTDLAATLNTLVYDTPEITEKWRRSRLLQPWHDAVNAKEREIAPNRAAFMQEAKRTKIKMLEASTNIIERDFGQYLTGIIG